MKTFAYTAFTTEGRRRRGVVVAEDEAGASAEITAMGLMPAEITARTARRSAGGGAERGAGHGAVRASWHAGRIEHDMLAVFTRQMAVLLGAGLSAEAALSAVQTAAAAPRIERLAAEARAGLMAGSPVSEALESAGGGLPVWFAAALRAGEKSGDLDSVFTTLADHLESSASDRAAIASALIYPAFVAVVAVLVCAVLMVTVAPEIVGLFEASGQELPALTRAVLAVTGFIESNWVALTALAAALVVLALGFARLPALRRRRDRLLLRLPLTGGFMRMAAAAQYLRTLALVVASRLPLTEALRFSADVVNVEALRAEAEAAGEALARGESVADSLRRLGFLHPVAHQLIQAGESSARLAPMTERAAVLAESALRSRRKRLAALLEPLAMVVVGAVVLAIVLAVLLPIFDMQAMVGS